MTRRSARPKNKDAPRRRVPEKGDVQFAVGDFCRTYLLVDFPDDPVREENTSRLNADHHDVVELQVVFQELMAQPPDGNTQLFFGQDGFQTECFYKSSKSLRVPPKKDIRAR